MREFFKHLNISSGSLRFAPARMFNLPAVAVMLFCAASVFSAPAYAVSKEKSKSRQQITHITQLQKQLLETVQRFASSNNLTTDQISTILTSAQKYFSTKRTYEKVLFNRLMQQDPSWHRVEYASFAQSNTRDQAAKVLLPLFQKYFSSHQSKLTLAQLIQQRNVLRQIKALNNGQLSGAVWLYNSPLTSFAISRLELINPQIIHHSLAQAKRYSGEHQYAKAQKIYQDLLQQYSSKLSTKNAQLLKVRLMRCIVDGYTYQSRRAMKKRRFTKARNYLHQIIAAYPDTQYAAAAQKQLQATVPVAVNYYKKVADSNFHPANIGVPQNKAASYYKRMYEEDPKGPKADYALYYWARTLGTQGKIKQEVTLLQQHLEQFPDSSTRAQAMYLLGFTYCNHNLRNYKKGISMLLKVAKDFPKSAQAPEALWNAAFVLGSTGKHPKAISLLQQLKNQYPKSKRAKWAGQWIKKYKEVM